MDETKRCPYCGEEILAVARKCKHCGVWLEEESENADREYGGAETDSDKGYVTEFGKDNFLGGFGKEIAGAVLVLCLGYTAYLLLGEKMPSYEGRWKNESTTIETDFDDDSPITEWTEHEISIDVCLSDGSDVETSTDVITAKIDDGDYRGTVELTYETKYTGTWEQHGQKLTFAGKDFEWELTGAEVTPNNSDGEYYMNELHDTMESAFDDQRDEIVGKQQDMTIVGVDYKQNKLMLDFGDGYIVTYTKLDSDIKKQFYWKPFKDQRVGKKVRVKRSSARTR